MNDPIITVTPTARDGQYVRWYRTVHDVEIEREAISVWRPGVIVHGYLTAVPEAWVETAWQVHATLAAAIITGIGLGLGLYYLADRVTFLWGATIREMRHAGWRARRREEP
jgi:hypothetical protein